MKKIDVVINVYGKPWQTLCTLKSLMKVSGKHIDKIYFIEEKEQPYGDSVKFILNEFDNLIHYIPKEYVFTKITDRYMNNITNRFSFRYQFGIEVTDKKYVFITHNDILYTDNIIEHLLSNIEGCAGTGLIGQCWNCPAFMGNLCDGDRHAEYNPTYEEVITLTEKYKPARYTQHNLLLDKNQPMPLPECRLYEFACLIDINISKKECYPNGNTPLFGSYDTLDLGDAWFRSLILKGYKFKNYNIYNDCIHGYFSRLNTEYISGYPTQLDQQKYKNSEVFAKKYYEENFKNI